MIQPLIMFNTFQTECYDQKKIFVFIGGALRTLDQKKK